MSRVFVAEETTLGRRVVVKVLPPDTSGLASVDRFRREVQVAAQLQHPHIVPVLAAGETGSRETGDALLYYTMPLVDGETLRARLSRDGGLPVAVAIRILRDITKALSYAHRHGVVHRDIKPENVLLGEDGDALVTDFGVAKALAAAHTVPDATAVLTSIGMAVGTPAYMAPEQAMADPQTDHRADLYSLGVVAYEMLAGSHPFAGRSAQALVAAHTTEAPESLERRRSSVPPTIAALVMRLLEKHPADRPQTADELLQTLDAVITPNGALSDQSAVALPPRGAGVRWNLWRMVGAGAVTAAIAIGVVWYRRARPDSSPDQSQRVLVVAMRNETRDTSLASVGRMAADWITEGLVRLDGLSVVSDLASSSAAGDSALRAAARVNGAGIVVSGAYYVDGDSIRLQATVTDVAGWKRLPSIRAVSAPRSQPSALLEPLRQRVMGMLAERNDQSGSFAGDIPPSFDAYQLVVAGNQGAVTGDWAGALADWVRAASLDSLWARPRLGAAQAYVNLGRPAEADSMLKVVERLRPTLGASDLAVLNYMHSQVDGNTEGQLVAVREISRVTPGADLSHFLHGFVGVLDNRPHEALVALRRIPYRSSRFGSSQTGRTYWRNVTSAYHSLSQHERELEAARIARGYLPAISDIRYVELRAMAPHAQLDSLMSKLDELDDVRPTPSTAWMMTTPTILVALAEELEAHERPDVAKRVLLRSIDWQRTHPSVGPADAKARLDQSEALFLLGRFDEADPIVASLAKDYPLEPSYIALRGIVALRRNRPAEATGAAERLRTMRAAYASGALLYARAQITAQLGDTVAALVLLRQSLASGVSVEYAHADPYLKPLRQNAQFVALLRPKD